MTETAHLIVLAHTPFGEKSVVLHTIAKEYGRRGFLVRTGPKTPMTLFQPMNILEAKVVENKRSSLWTAHGFSSPNPLSHIRSDVKRNAITMFMGEVLYRTIKDGVQEDGIYDWLEREVMTLESMECGFSNFHVRFVLDFAGVMGFRPSVEDLAPFAGEWMPQLSAFVRGSFEESMLMPLSGVERGAMCDAILRYLEHHAESSIRIRSLSVLHDIFA